ncbi:hypothetical protein [Chitinophaga sancti]|uniref:hypothetical protein n=1 Tax=Chitinophaga sancti TaxID=1004 RepID=UPI003F79E5F2
MKTNTVQNIFRIILGSFMLLAGIGHLTFQRSEFLAQVPRWLPDSPTFMDFIVLSSGAVEILLGLSMIFLSKFRPQVGIALAVFYILIFPGNISQYTNHINAFGLDTEQKRLIRLFFQPLLAIWALWSTNGWRYIFKRKTIDPQLSIYDFNAKTLSGSDESLGKYKGKTIIVVNTASKCGLTPQYEGLEKLYKKYKDQGLVILGFPCSQFANQELNSSKEIEEFCQVNYGVSFPMFDKVDVNGKGAHPIFTYLKNELGGVLGNNIKWNFTKFVIDKNGKPVKRFAPTTKPEKMDTFISELL